MSSEKWSVLDRVCADVVREAISQPCSRRCRPRRDRYSTTSMWCSISQPLHKLLEVSHNLGRSEVVRASGEQRNFDSYGSHIWEPFSNTVSADGGALPTVGRRSGFRNPFFARGARGECMRAELHRVEFVAQQRRSSTRIESNRLNRAR